jgi:hypothetical protein
MTTDTTVLETSPTASTEAETDTEGAMTLDQWIAWSGGAS